MHLNEEQLELTALKFFNNEIVDNESREHIDGCESCKSKVDFFILFYKNLEEEFAEPADQKVKEFANKISSPRIIRLKYYRPEANIPQPEGNKNILVLAAETKNQSDVGHVNVVKFASEPHKVLVRIVEDKNKNNFHIYILSEKEEYRNQTLIAVSDGKEHINFTITDKDGTGTFPFTTIKDWQTVSVILFMPATKFHFENGIRKEGTIKQDSILLNIKEDKEHFIFHITSEFEMLHCLLAIFADENKILIDVIDNKVSFSKDQGEKIREIRLY